MEFQSLDTSSYAMMVKVAITKYALLDTTSLTIVNTRCMGYQRVNLTLSWYRRSILMVVAQFLSQLSSGRVKCLVKCLLLLKLPQLVLQSPYNGKSLKIMAALSLVLPYLGIQATMMI